MLSLFVLIIYLDGIVLTRHLNCCHHDASLSHEVMQKTHRLVSSLRLKKSQEDNSKKNNYNNIQIITQKTKICDGNKATATTTMTKAQVHIN